MNDRKTAERHKVKEEGTYRSEDKSDGWSRDAGAESLGVLDTVAGVASEPKLLDDVEKDRMAPAHYTLCWILQLDRMRTGSPIIEGPYLKDKRVLVDEHAVLAAVGGDLGLSTLEGVATSSCGARNRLEFTA